MIRAFGVKGFALAVGLAASWVVPPSWLPALVIAIVVVTVGFLSYAVVHPKSQFFARVVHRLPTGERVIALTFDDGPDPTFTPQILDLLREHRATATFFVLGARAAQFPDIVRRMHREGHAVGTHTQRHLVRFHFGSPRYVQREIETAVDAVAAILAKRPTLFRPPQGLRTPFFASGWRRTSGLTCVTWSARGFDSRPTTSDAIVARLHKRLEPGAIITLHDGIGLGGGTDRRPTIGALAAILAQCQQRGLRCVALGAGEGAIT